MRSRKIDNDFEDIFFKDFDIFGLKLRQLILRLLLKLFKDVVVRIQVEEPSSRILLGRFQQTVAV